MSDYVTIERLPLQWRSFFTNGEVIDLYEDLTIMSQMNQSLNEEDVQQLHQFLQYAERIHRFTEEGYFALGLDTVSEIIKYQGPFNSLKVLITFQRCKKPLIDMLKSKN